MAGERLWVARRAYGAVVERFALVDADDTDDTDADDTADADARTETDD